MLNATKRCPICGQLTDSRYAPFCSKHCADVDLGRCLKGVYVVHTNETPESQEISQKEEEE